MPFEPSRYSDTASAIESLAPLAISAGTAIATTAITHGGKKRHPASAPPPPPAPVSAGIPYLPILGGVAAVLTLGAVAFGLSRPKKAPADKRAAA